MSFLGLVIVCVVAFLAPLASNAIPRVRIPAIVLEIVAGILIGPAVLGWVHVDEPIRVLSVLGLSFLLFLAGLELDLKLIAGRRLQVTLAACAVSAALAYAIALGLHALGIELHELTRPNASALVAAGLLSVVLFPMTAVGLLRRSRRAGSPATEGLARHLAR